MEHIFALRFPLHFLYFGFGMISRYRLYPGDDFLYSSDLMPSKLGSLKQDESLLHTLALISQDSRLTFYFKTWLSFLLQACWWATLESHFKRLYLYEYVSSVATREHKTSHFKISSRVVDTETPWKRITSNRLIIHSVFPDRLPWIASKMERFRRFNARERRRWGCAMNTAMPKWPWLVFSPLKTLRSFNGTRMKGIRSRAWTWITNEILSAGIHLNRIDFIGFVSCIRLSLALSYIQ